jgi:ribosomal protein S18 acetylase RimI-like enzyme
MKEKSKNENDIIIRRFRIDDYEQVIELWKNAQLPFKPLGRDTNESINNEIKKDTALFFVAEYKRQIIGSVFATHDGRKGWINRLAVDPKYQRQDIGRLLVSEVEMIFEKKGINIIACLIEDWNHSSQRFFETVGYQKHEDIAYYSKRKNDDI